MNEKGKNKGRGKIALFFASIFFGILLVLSGLSFMEYYDYGYYSSTFEDIVNEKYQRIAMLNGNQIEAYIQRGDREAATEFCNDRNIAYLQIRTGGFPNRQIYTYERDASSGQTISVTIGETVMDDEDVYYYSENEVTVVLMEDLPIQDAYREAYNQTKTFYDYRYIAVLAGVVSLILCLLCMVLLFCRIGYVPGKEGVQENWFSKIPFDVVTLAAGLVICFGFMLLWENFVNDTFSMGIVAVLCVVTAYLWTLNLAHRIKLENVFGNTLLAKFFRLLGRLFRNIPLIWKAVLIIAGIAIVEICVFFLGYAFGELEEALVLFALAWGFRMIILCPVTLYIVLMMKLLFKGGKELASGNTEYRVNPGPLFGEYRKHAENLNNLSDGINKAVEERMKSERMKTELITNVSHDIKTPLTSIINYSDLIGREAESMYTPDAEENGHVQNIKEYAGVLHNQSGKLKRLMEDLIEVSKANSGNLEVSLETLELGTMLEQVAGEYEGRLESQNLELIINKPDGDVFVTADRGKLWRIMDNLMQNIYKYAHPGTRVYVGMQENGAARAAGATAPVGSTVAGVAATGNCMAEVVFKNTSHEPLNLSPEELTERFTRGDSSRHKEGNGLGLAIAKAMAELQSGELRIEVDGDLFKVTVTLPLAEKDEAEISPDTTATEEIAATAETAAIAETATETEVL